MSLCAFPAVCKKAPQKQFFARKGGCVDLEYSCVFVRTWKSK